MTHSFYLTLPSNVYDLSFENKLSDYITYLPTTLHLTDNYEVALTEFSYTKSWYNLQSKPYFSLFGKESLFIRQYTDIKPGYYDTPEKIVGVVNAEIQKKFSRKNDQLSKLPTLHYDEYSHMMYMLKGEIVEGSDRKFVLAHLGEELEEMLGFTDLNLNRKLETSEIKIIELPHFSEKHKQAKRLPDLKAGVHSLMVYSDIVSPNIVGNAYANLLRAVPVEQQANFGDDCNITFSKPYYMPLTSNTINKIQINIKDDSGKDIDFRFGRVSVTLHFKKKWRTII